MTRSSGMQNYIQYIEGLKAAGTRLAQLNCPLCQQSLQTPTVPAGEVCDTLTDCPHCGRMFLLITEGEDARGVYPA